MTDNQFDSLCDPTAPGAQVPSSHATNVVHLPFKSLRRESAGVRAMASKP